MRSGPGLLASGAFAHARTSNVLIMKHNGKSSPQCTLCFLAPSNSVPLIQAAGIIVLNKR
jgi:hypothetical protein